jgi:hypothetical protein
MAKLTDTELDALLRETFAGKEDLVETLPEATRSRRGPVLLAAASVLVVLGGIMYAAQGAGRDAPVSHPTVTVPGATIASTPDAPSTVRPHLPPSVNSTIWAAAIAEILKIERPADGWQGIRILDAPNAGAGGTGTTYELAKPFTADERLGMANALSGIAPVQWVRNRPVGPDACGHPSPTEPYVTVGPAVTTQGHVEVGINVWRGCDDARWLTYRLDQMSGTWTVTGTVGPQGIS